MGQKQKIREAKKASGDLKVDKTTRAGYDRNNVAEVIKRLKQMAKEDTDRFDKMDLAETLERLEQSERVAATIGAAYDVEMARKRALLRCFVEHGIPAGAGDARERRGVQRGRAGEPVKRNRVSRRPRRNCHRRDRDGIGGIGGRREEAARVQPVRGQTEARGGQRNQGAQRRDGEGVTGAGIGSARDG